MIQYKADYTYVISNQTKLFTAYILPNNNGKFPVVIARTPYVDCYENVSETDILLSYMKEYSKWLENGYAVVIQHCRGRGKSEGQFVCFMEDEREDGIELQNWIRKQEFYNGELFLKGTSYTTSVHYMIAPFESDVKGAVFGVQDSERYNLCYRNGFYKKALYGNWYVWMYKAKSKMKKNYTENSFDILPFSDFSKTVFGEKAVDFDEILKHPERNSEFWDTKEGGAETSKVTDDVGFPILFTTGFYDIYTGGIFDMWRNMSEKSRALSALVVSPYDHGDWCGDENSITFKNGRRTQQFGADYEIEWFNYIRNRNNKSPFKQGQVTYYNLFENTWRTDDFLKPDNNIQIKLANNEASFVYNPYDAPRFKGGLSCNFGGAVFQDKPGLRHDIISIYTDSFEKDTWVRGKMSAKLSVKSDCEDTCFYIRISITKEQGDYGLRDDITSICYQHPDYTKNTVVDLEFNFDEHSFLIKKGEKLRIDIASADNEHYVRHTNNKGLYSEQTTAKIAKNTVVLNDSYLVLPVKEYDN